MKPWITLLCFLSVASPGPAAEPLTTNSVGMEFVLIPSGNFIYGRFAPPFIGGGTGTNSLSAAQQSVIAQMNDRLAAAELAATTTRTALVASAFGEATRSHLDAQIKALSEMELALAQARADAFNAIQQSTNRLSTPQITTLIQQAPAAGPGARGGGGRGGNPADIATANELIRSDREKYPGFSVTIPRAFYLGRFEVTQEQWKKVMGNNPSTFQDGRFGVTSSDRHPVESVNWADAQAFVKKLNELEQTDVYRLPTEFEWEYAGKAGSLDDPPWNDNRAAAVIGNARVGTTMPVGTRTPNAWGLYDMLGNVWEWVQDYYNEKQYNDPVPPTTGTQHVLKGTGFLADVKNAIYSTHGAGPADKWEVGFRVLREAR